MADETMFARLRAAVEAEMGDVDSDRIVRALLTELRTPSESMNRACPQMSAWDAWTEAVDFILAEAGGSGGA